MINRTHATVPSLPAMSLEFVTMDDVRRIVERRLRWYGLDEIAVKGIGRDAKGAIAVTIADRRRNETYRHVFVTSLTVTGSADEGKRSLAA